MFLLVLFYLDTHGHFDHVDLSGNLVKELNCPVTLHPADNTVYVESPKLIKMFRMSSPVTVMPPVC